MPIEDEMQEKLTEALAPSKLVIENQSHLHAGHAGDDGSGESHFFIEIVSESFRGQSRVARERMVHGILGDTVISKIHALSMRLAPP